MLDRITLDYMKTQFIFMLKKFAAKNLYPTKAQGVIIEYMIHIRICYQASIATYICTYSELSLANWIFSMLANWINLNAYVLSWTCRNTIFMYSHKCLMYSTLLCILCILCILSIYVYVLIVHLCYMENEICFEFKYGRFNLIQNFPNSFSF